VATDEEIDAEVDGAVSDRCAVDVDADGCAGPQGAGCDRGGGERGGNGVGLTVGDAADSDRWRFGAVARQRVVGDASSAAIEAERSLRSVGCGAVELSVCNGLPRRPVEAVERVPETAADTGRPRD